MNEDTPDKPETLDPENWEAMRALAHRIVDDSIDYLASVAERPVWTPVPDAVKDTFERPVPETGQDADAVYREFQQHIFPYTMGNIHPRFWAWYMGSGTVTGALADYLAAIMNPNIGGGSNAPIMVEGQVVNWMKQILELPDSWSGLLVSGGSMGNLVGVAVARNSGAGFDVRKHGLQVSSGPVMCVYGSSEMHSSVQKAVELLGIGNDYLRRIPVKPDFCIDCDALRNCIEADIAEGMSPVCVVASAGTVNTGAIDDLNRIADICTEYGIHFHVDGAIGAIGMLSDTVKPQLSGLQRADSISLDLHKWMHIPFEAGCILVRDEKAHKETFSVVPEYLQKAPRGIAAGSHWYAEYGVQLSRAFRALKVWMTIKEHGARKLGRMISKNVEQAHYLSGLVSKEPELEQVAPVGLDIVCYRYLFPGDDTEKSNRLNNEIVVELQEQGIAAPSFTTLRGIGCIRVAIANHRSRNSDFDMLVNESVRIGRELQSL